ncbi:MAG: glycosyltransferase family 4 protein [Gemmatimonadota bacterium]|nr:glycosyltransferase family 4 protein [Gemmatimonadota bacterium]
MSRRPLRLAMITTFYPPFNFGGDGIAIQRLSRALVRRGHRVTVIHDADAYNVLSRGPEPGPGTEPEGLDVIPLRSGAAPISTLLTQQVGRPVLNGRRIRRILDDGGFDVIHYNNVSLVGGPGILALGSGLKVYEAHEHWLVCPSHVLWRHGREVCTGRECLRCVLSYRRPPQAWRYTGLLNRRLDEIDVFIAKSAFSRDKHHEFGFPRDMEVLPYFLPDLGPEEEARGPASAADPEVPGRAEAGVHERPYFLFVGRLERIKGLDDVIPAFDGYEGADLLIAGDGTYEDDLRSLADGNPRVRFLGRVDPDELRRYYASAVALIVPSICFETFGIILIEAFRQGTPVIARRIGPFPEIVEACGGGELFETRDELLAAMDRMRSDPAHRDRCAANGLRGFRERWSESAVVPRYLELLGDAAERAGRDEVARVLREAA